MDMDRARKAQEREILRNLITQWNANRLDLFELSEPNEELEFHGVMRFYFQDAGQKVATKCIRVSSTAVAQAVIKTLIEKFRPDMRMLSIPEYALYEIHENGEERKLGEEEKPLLVQLNWHKDDREGRFLLRRMDEKTYMTPQHFEDEVNFKRKLSKREKKEKKKKEKLLRLKENEENKDGLAERLYTELPETSFTRSISNPEAVMRRRRQQKLEKKLQQFRSRDGGPDSGGTLRIYGESLCKDVPYKTLLLSVRDNAAHVVKEMLNKYALDKEDAANYCLVQSIAMGEGENKEFTTPGKEYILDDDECPLAILMNYQHPVCGSVTFHVRRRPADYQPRKRKKKPKPTHADGEYRYDDMIDRLPYLIELNPDGSEIVNSTPRRHHLHLNVTEVGSERAMSTSGQYLQLFGPNVQPRHCVVAHTDGIVTVTPCSRNAETYVHSQRIFETTILQHGMVVRFGKIHNFRFIDPMLEERRQRHESASGQLSDFQGDRHSTKDDSSLQTSVLETTFDGDHVETVSTSSQKDDRRSEKSDKIKERPLVYDRYEHRRGHDPILPAVLEFREDGEDPFLRVIITNVEPNQVQFKLAPTYSLYMSARFRASTHYRPDITPTERAHRLTNLMNKVAAMIQHVIQEKYTDANALAFWMANASELLHFLKQDRHVSAYTLEAQDLLADSVQVAFRNLVQCLQADLQMIMPAFVDDRDDINEDEGTTAEFLAVLSAAMSLLRRCRVNAALTIQLFSQLFHFVNMWLFNKLVCESRPNYCTRLWGVRLKRRLSRIELWAEKQGLELAADCHLSRVAQTAHLLQSPKSSPDDIATISSTCFKLNSLQLRAVLEKYQPVMDEPRIPQELVENVVKVAENTADELARTDGREVRLEEDPDLQLPFLLPEDGYSCDIVRGVPAGLQEFLHPLQQAGLCRLTIQPTSSGYWTIYMSDQDITRATQLRSASSLGQHGGVSDLSRIGKEPEIAVIKLQKSNNGMGLSIVAAKGVGQEKLGIYIKSVVKGGAADADGRLQAGDQLLKVDGQSLVGITQEKAAEYMTRTGSVVTLEVAKQGAIYHGLATLLSQPSPVMQRASMRRAQAQTNNNSTAFENIPSNPPANANVPNSHSSPSFFNHQPIDDPTNLTGSAAIANNGWCSLPGRGRRNNHGSSISSLTDPAASKAATCAFNKSLCLSSSSSGRVLPPSLPRCTADCPVCSGDGNHGRLTASESVCDFTAPVRNSAPLSRILSCDILASANSSSGPDGNCRKWKAAGGNYNPNLHAYKFCYVPLVNSSRPLRPPKDDGQSRLKSLTNSTSLPNSLGYPSARRLSERDLPSRVSREPGADLDPRHVPRIQSSKSVPSLASGPQVQEPTRAPSSGNLKVPQEVFNPGYSRTSSTTSIAKAHEQMPPSRDGTIRSNGPMYAAENQRGRPVSQPNLQQQEERFYQNISLYQQKDSNMKMSPQYAEYQQHQQQVPPSPKSPIAPYDDYNAHHPQQPQQQLPPKPLPHDGYVQQQQAQPQQPAKPAPYDEYGQHPLPSPKLMPQGQYDDRFNRGMRGSQSSLHRTEPNAATVGRERPMSALVSQRERDQFMGNGPPGVQADDRQQPAYHSMRQLDQNGKPYDPRSPNMQNGRYPDGYYGEDGARMDPRMAGPGGRPVGMESQNGEPRRSEADYLRQQAKMEEMREEVRRREERNQRDIQVRQTATWNGNANMHASPHHQQPPMRPPPTHANKPMPPNAYPQPPPQHVVDQQGYNTNYGPHGPFIAQGFNNKMPPPNLKPKPYVQGPEKPQRQYPAEGPPNVGYPPNSDIPPERPPLPDEANLYRDSPPPPPPPPVSTHPLVQQQQQQRSVSMQNGINYRYGPPERQGLNDQYGPRSPVHASDIRHHSRPANQPPRVSFDTRLQDPAAKGFSNSLDTTTTPISPSPWEREEREKERKNRLADARRLRDQEIQALEACSYRTPKQEERMRTLRLEQEFQRRAEELKTNDDEDDNEEDDDISERRGVLRMVQEDMERNRLRRLERENEERLRQQQQQQQQQHHHQQHENPFGRIDSSGHNHRATLGRPELPSSNHNTDDWLRRQQDIKNQRKEQREEEERQRQQKVEEDRIRQQKLEEVRRKREQEKAAMRELQAAREAEDRLIREAQRRQEEDLKLRAMQQHHQQQIQQQQQQQIQQQQQQQMQQQQQQQMQQQQSPYHYGGEYNHSPASPTAYGSYPQQYPPSSNYQPGHNSSPSSGAAQRLDNLLTSGQPTYGHVPVEGPARTSNHIPGPNQQHPEKRHDSENAAVPNSNTEVPPVPPTNSIPRSAVSHSRNEAAPPKRVSFHDAKLETLCDDNDDDEEEEEEDESSRNQTNSSYSSQHTYNTDDPSMLLTPSNPQQLFSTGNSPGVIGAQEVYRDPRNKIQAQRQSQMPKLPGPEKLSFKEKMKMFALETGDTESPSDKVKISRAQREIETNINGS